MHVCWQMIRHFMFLVLVFMIPMKHPGEPVRTELERLIRQGDLADLRWPDFRDCQDEVSLFYEGSRYELAWVDANHAHAGTITARAREMIGILQEAAEKGLDPEDYDASRWPGRLSAIDRLSHRPSDTELTRFDLALTISVLRYVSDLQSGRVDPGLYRFEFDQEHRYISPSALVRQQVLLAPDLKTSLAEIDPPFDGYRRTLAALAHYRALAREDDGELLPQTKKPVEPGDVYAGVPRLARLLRTLGDLPPDAVRGADDRIYSRVLVEAVKRFQGRHGLLPDGRIGKGTLAQLNTPLTRRVRQIELTLERWRWVPHSFSRPPIVVNVPEFELRAFGPSYASELEMKVIVGGAYRHKTPVFSGELKLVIFHPYWNVPLSIQRAELVPQLERDRSYLAQHDYEVVTQQGAVVTNGTISDELLPQLRSGKLLIRQIPGPKNALGLVKFVFPNPNDVYMHDTPGIELFARSRRDFSHGCIRVEKAAELAEWVLREEPDWSPDRIHEAMNGPKPLQVLLKRPIPVLIVYGTAVVLEGGEVRFFEDFYGDNAALEAQLARGYPRSSATIAVPGPRPRE